MIQENIPADAPAEVRTPTSGEAGTSLGRLTSVDVLRGLVMVIMALDHTRDFFSNSANLFDPTDLTHTSPMLFFTRWITHFCAPVFVFLAGSGAYLSLTRGKDVCELSKFLMTRGVWLIFLELFVISPLGWSLSLSFAFTRLQVIWVIGVSMVILGGLIQLYPSRLIAGLGVAMILGHDLFDGPHASWLGEAAGAWGIVHQIQLFTLWRGHTVASLYPLIPWIGVMMAGYGFGELLAIQKARRRRVVMLLGASMTVGFVLIRAFNLYGDPSPWSFQDNPIYTVMSFLNCGKYPPSLLYVMMTLGPALLFLAFCETRTSRTWQYFQTFGRVPLFYYLLHLPVIHVMAVLFSLVTYGEASWLYRDLMNSRAVPSLPAGYGYGLPVVYGVWIATVLMLYPLCQWFANVKKTRREAVFSFL
jgi:uncharacterized membrane protein